MGKNPKDLKEDMASLQLSTMNWKFIPTHGVHFAHMYIGTYHTRTACWLRRLTKYEEPLVYTQGTEFLVNCAYCFNLCNSKTLHHHTQWFVASLAFQGG